MFGCSCFDRVLRTLSTNGFIPFALRATRLGIAHQPINAPVDIGFVVSEALMLLPTGPGQLRSLEDFAELSGNWPSWLTIFARAE